MISINELASMFESGLNSQLYEEYIKFRIWGSAGENQPLERISNTVTEYVYGVLSRTTSANDASTIEMGATTYLLDLFVPIKRPMVSSSGTPLPRIVQGQYPFLDTIITAVDTYFSLAKNFQHYDAATQSTISIGMNSEISTTGTVELLPIVGNGVRISVGIELLFVQNGMNSRSISLSVDDTTVRVPYQNVQIGASAVRSNDVRAGETRSRSYDSAASVSFSITFPALNDSNTSFTQTLFSYIFGPVPNEVHFVAINVITTTYYYLMLLDSPNASAQQVANVGFTVSFTEAIGDAEIMNIPSSYRIGRFTVASSTVTSITFSLSASCMFYIAGNAYMSSGSQTIALSEKDIVYDEADDEYYVYLITNKSVSVTGGGGIEWL